MRAYRQSEAMLDSENCSVGVFNNRSRSPSSFLADGESLHFGSVALPTIVAAALFGATHGCLVALLPGLVLTSKAQASAETYF